MFTHVIFSALQGVSVIVEVTKIKKKSLMMIWQYLESGKYSVSHEKNIFKFIENITAIEKNNRIEFGAPVIFHKKNLSRFEEIYKIVSSVIQLQKLCYPKKCSLGLWK